MDNYQILSLDGGGVRGILTVRLLERLTNERGLENAFDSVNLIAGNSSGGLIALAMARARAGKVPMKVALAEIRKVFENGSNVFGPALPFPLGFWIFSRYRTEKRRQQFEESLKNIKLRELGTQVLITTFDLDNKGTSEERSEAPRRWKPKVFHNFKRADGREQQHKDRTPDSEHLASEVALYTTAAPGYFPTVDGYIDGGVFANNPSMCALAQVLDYRYQPFPKPVLDNILLFSVGAGQNSTFIDGPNHSWGILRWALRNYVGLTMDATVGIADYQCRQILGEENYRRLDVEFPTGIAFDLDAVSNVGKILEVANEVDLGPQAEWLKRYWVPRPRPVPKLPDATSKHVLGTTELTCLMPIKEGFVDVFETHTYATRLRIVMRALHAIRLASRELSPVRVIPDIVDAIRSIHSFRLSILDSRQLLLAVTFDRPWEPYMRIIWRDLGPLLDLILLNCDKYEERASNKGFDRFASWVRDHQIESELFYVSSSHTVDDVAYLTQLEQLVRQKGTDPQFNAIAARLQLKDPVEITTDAARSHPDEVVRQGLLVLNVFYKLRDVYRDDTPDAAFLAAAVKSTLKTFDPAHPPIPEDLRDEYGAELDWFSELMGHENKPLTRPPEFDQVQGGIVRSYQNVTHGCLLLARIEDPTRARGFLATMLESQRITRHDDAPKDGVFTNVALTFGGLKRLGVSEADLTVFPKEFREGMEARAGLLGDVRSNHPDNWELPKWDWPRLPSDPSSRPIDRVRLSTIDLVIQLRDARESQPSDPVHAWSENHPLYGAAHALLGDPDNTGVRVLSVQAMVHHRKPGKGDKPIVVEHFGFADGISQPLYPPVETRAVGQHGVKLGELVLGYENDRGDPPFFDKDDARVLPRRSRHALLDNGTFLVVRKLQQNVGALNRAIKKFLAAPQHSGLSEEVLLGKLMGRDRQGIPLTDPKPAGHRRREMHNDFTYGDDDGSKCPLHAHIRRGNPRTEEIPRIARRGMAYGPRYEDAPNDPERGMMFLAYNASIAEQFEVIQRWMTGGNSTGSFSGCPDPFLRVPEPGQPLLFTIPHDNGVLHVELDEPFVELQWGMYLFVPSMAAIKQLSSAPSRDLEAAAGRVALGEATIARLLTDDQWSAILEDSTAQSSGRTAAVCAAIRELHGGVFRTPGGGMVLVASEALGMREVLANDELFSVSEYRARMAQSIGEIYLGMDSHDDDYKRLSTLPNAAIETVGEKDAFVAAHAMMESRLQNVLEKARRQPIRLPLEPVVDLVLADLSNLWFHVPDGHFIKLGGRPARGGMDQSVHCPFHFLAPSRFIFSSPLLRKIVGGAGQLHGAALRGRFEKLARHKKDAADWPDTLPSVTRAVWDASLDTAGEIDYDLFARMIVGVLEGFLPTVYGNFLKIMHLWLSDETFWRVQQNLVLEPGDNDHARATDAVLPSLLRAMQARPVPDMIYRTARKQTTLGGITVEEGDRVVVLVSSATQELAADGDVGNVYPVFGGNRQAPSHPTHSCPGYQMGLGVLLGMVTAVLEAGSFAPTATPLVVKLSSSLQAPAQGPPAQAPMDPGPYVKR